MCGETIYIIGWKFPSLNPALPLSFKPFLFGTQRAMRSRPRLDPVPPRQENPGKFYKLTPQILNVYRGYEGRSRGVDSLIQRKTDEEKNESGEIIRVRLPQKRNKEMFAQAELMMGANHIRVKCYDGVTRMGRIKGKIKKKVWIREGDILVVIPWSFQDDKCDIIYRYTGPQVEWLRRNGYL